MRRLTSITVIGLACLLSLPVYAQRGMGGGRSMGGGGFRGSGGFHSSAPGGPRGSAPSRSFAPRSAPGSFAPRTFAPRTFAPRTFAPRPFAPRTFAPTGTHVFSRTSGGFVSFPGRTNGFVRFRNNGFFFNNRFFFHHRFFSRGCFGCFSPFFFDSGFFFGDPFFFGGPFISAPFWDPFYDGYPGYPPDYYAPPPAPVVENSDNGGNAQLAADVQHLTDEVEDLRSENRNYYNRSESNSNSSISAKEPSQPAVFIFKDGRRVTAQNYAIAGETLWIMDEHAAHKFALSELDATATEHANAINGVDVRIPAAKP